MAQFRLKQHYKKHNSDFCCFPKDKADHGKPQYFREPQNNQKQQKPLRKIIGIRLPDQLDQFKNQKSNDQNIHYIGYSDCLYIIGGTAKYAFQCTHLPTSSINTTACAEIPSPSPVKPSRSSVVAFTET